MLSKLATAIRGTIPRPMGGLVRVETTMRHVEGVEQLDNTDGLSPDDYRLVLSEPERFVALVPII